MHAGRPLAYGAAMDAHALYSFRRAGTIAAEARDWAFAHVEPGARMRDVLEGTESLIRERGGEPGFPAQSSRNAIAAHYCSAPDDETRYEVGDCVKVDIGVHIDGYVADTAATKDLSDDGRWQALIDASAAALEAAIGLAGPGALIPKMGGAIERTIVDAGYEPIRSLTGHGLGRWLVHTKPQIPNVAHRGAARLHEGMVIAIEPFATTGRGTIVEQGQPEVFMLAGQPLETEGIDPDLLESIVAWNGLPIARRYFQEHADADVSRAFALLARQGVLVLYPPLVVADEAMVAQTEHTLYVGADGVELLTGWPATDDR